MGIEDNQYSRDVKGRPDANLYALAPGERHVLRTMSRAELFDLRNAIDMHLDRKQVVLWPCRVGSYSYEAREWFYGAPGQRLGYYTDHGKTTGLPEITEYEGTTILDSSEFQVVAAYG